MCSQSSLNFSQRGHNFSSILFVMRKFNGITIQCLAVALSSFRLTFAMLIPTVVAKFLLIFSPLHSNQKKNGKYDKLKEDPRLEIVKRIRR
ncbi:hypothetical protein RhiirA5_444726 [Rhizophagus irregularis]|uniref:Uncharacterized protein n=1 Tax=Rhizophagus irregularis TaxID=588596 RepID=A0A2N0NCX1_9GLOM|nr:hypothetical protein RhiirA5_444726 [Rhizophagus irregularis]